MLRSVLFGLAGVTALMAAACSSTPPPGRADGGTWTLDSAPGLDSHPPDAPVISAGFDAPRTADAAPAADAAPLLASDGPPLSPPPGGLAPAGSPCPPGATYGNPLPASAAATTIRSGFMEAEGPVWVASKKVLLVSDFDEKNLTRGRIMRFDPATNQWDVFADNVGTNGLAVDGAGHVIAASHDMHALTRFDLATGARSLVVGTYNGKPFNEVNDVVVRNDGNMYFTDPLVQPGSHGNASQDATAYYRLSPAGVVTRIGTGELPNGIALSPDGRTLYEGGTHPLRKHAVAADGTVDPTFTQLGVTGTDGMSVDCAGNLYLTAGNGVRVISATGEPLGMISVPSSGFMTNSAFGGEDGKTLYITTRNAVHQLKVNVPGFPD
jgi:gluconolactonase